jgi:hypothetical protein
MAQVIITGIIVVTAFGITVYRFIRFFQSPDKKSTGCTVACKGCALGEGIHKAGITGRKP